MKFRLLIMCLAFASTLLSHEEGSFADNHFRFIAEHLPQLLEGDTGKVLLIGTENLFNYKKLNKKHSSIHFDCLSIWNKQSWDKIARDRNWSETFDCIVALNILERAQNREQVIQLICELLRPGGKLLIYIDPKEMESFDQKIEYWVENSEWKEQIPIIPSLSIPEYQQLIESTDFYILDQAPAEYRIYFNCSFYAFLCVYEFACSRWPVPRREWDEEQFSWAIKGLLKRQHEITEVPNACPIFNCWTEDVLPTYYFKFQKK